MEQALDEGMPHIVAVAALACSFSLFSQPPVDAAILALGFCVPAVYGARLVQAAYLSWGRPDVTPGAASRRRKMILLVGACVVLAFMLTLVKKSGDVNRGLLARLWSLLVLLTQAAATAVLLAIAFEISGSSKVELADALSRDRTSYSEGAAWIFFLGYLDIIFNESGRRFAERMDDYLASHEINERDRENTCRWKMFILIPMKLDAILSDDNFQGNDLTIERESTLRAAAVEGSRRFGETRVYRVRQGNCCYRVAMEEATPMRTACLAVEDTDADFDEADYEAFASRFLKTLRKILEKKPNIGSQIELVPIYTTNQLGSTVVQRLLDVQGDQNLQQGQNPEREPERRQEQDQDQEQERGSEASREPEERSELDSTSWR